MKLAAAIPAVLLAFGLCGFPAFAAGVPMAEASRSEGTPKVSKVKTATPAPVDETVSSAQYSSALNPLLQHDSAAATPAPAAPAAAAIPTATAAPASVRSQSFESAEPFPETSEPSRQDSNWATSPDYEHGMPI